MRSIQPFQVSETLGGLESWDGDYLVTFFRFPRTFPERFHLNDYLLDRMQQLR